jgi:digeranylgeranylglycerophospholipid reductase
LSDTPVDLAVVGCGVSGAAAAHAASQLGLSVTILEEHPRVGEPSHCSGHVGIMAFKQFSPPIPDRLIENRIKGAKLYSPNQRQITLYKSSPVTWVLNRAEYDKHLAHIASRSGANLKLNSRVEKLSRSTNGILRLRVAGRGELPCRMLIDASGCSASIARYEGLSKLGHRMLVNSAQINVENLDDVDEDFVEVYFGQHFAPGFFGWIIPRHDGTAKVGIAAGSRANVRECLDNFLRKHPIVSSKVRHAKRLTVPTYHPIPVDGATHRTYTDSILVVGDAASQVKPTTGGGIVFGLACGELAGKMAAKGIRSNHLSASDLKEYEKQWRRLIGFDLWAMSWLRRMLYRLPDRYLDRIFRVASELRAAEILNRTADIDFQGRTMLSLARDPRFFLTLVSASILSTPSLIQPEAVRSGLMVE